MTERSKHLRLVDTREAVGHPASQQIFRLGPRLLGHGPIHVDVPEVPIDDLEAFGDVVEGAPRNALEVGIVSACRALGRSVLHARKYKGLSFRAERKRDSPGEAKADAMSWLPPTSLAAVSAQIPVGEGYWYGLSFGLTGRSPWWADHMKIAIQRRLGPPPER